LFALDAKPFTTSVVHNILTAVPNKKEKLPLSVTHPEVVKETLGGVQKHSKKPVPSGVIGDWVYC